MDNECELDEDMISKACLEYNDKLEELQAIIAQSSQAVSKVKNIAQELKDIKMTVAQASTTVESPEMKAAIKAAYDSALQTEQKFGKNSPEARVAWTDLEEVASSGLSNAMGPILNAENCDIEETSITACEALEEVNRVLSKLSP